MMVRKFYGVLVVLLLLGYTATAQYIQVDDSYTAQQLVDALVGNSCAQVSNVSISGISNVQPSYGYFSGTTSSFPFTGGIVLSSGLASSAHGPNTGTPLSQGPDTWLGDSDLETALNISDTHNATVLEFDFIPVTSNINFDYIFASEEYLEHPDSPQWCNFSDGFAFLIKPAGSADAYQNLAVVPNTIIPVKVTTVRGQGDCPAANSEYFNGYNAFVSPTAFNGQTVVLTASANVIAGTTYHIKLVIADQGDTQFDSAIFLGEDSFNAVTDIGPDRLLLDGNPLCSGENYTMDGTTPGAVSYQWYKNDVAITGATNALYTATIDGVYKIEAQFAAGCFARGEATLEYAPAISTAPFIYNQCDDNNDGLTAYYLSQISSQIIGADTDFSVLSYHNTASDANADINPVTTANDTTPFYNTTPGQQLFARLQNQYGCTVVVPVTLSVSTPVVAVQPVTGQCDDDGTDDGFVAFNLAPVSTDILTHYAANTTVKYFTTFNDALSNGPTIGTTFTNTTANTQTIYARLDNTQGCASILEVPLQVYSFGAALQPEQATLCDTTPLTFDAGAGYAAYSWDTDPVQTTRSITVTTPGTYTVTLTTVTGGCTGTRVFTALQSGAATGATYDVNDFQGSHNTLTLKAQGSGSYEYSLDGIIFQASPLFEDLEPGKYTFYIRDTNGCGPVYTNSLYILDYPLYFTPNNDNEHDTWRIPYMYTRPGISVTIYDRFGKLITNFSRNSPGWDGTLNGRPLPASDYWFAIQLENGDVVKGHFSLIR